ncbi:hypothetical protein HNV10_16970 [Winogradskyella litoriviva]|uniref:PH domain-containing protein n=1 Tax=Winogradskyella litoriviva TaxID=1220182 RepID=A0ABX2E8W7_9FLAO|nr:hypothetical protein [Winogradskyella litoriviva]NRD24945.1 hypothetical protein [Winogradskyella litoriviva]
MNKIHFDNNKNWIWIAILILSGIFIVCGGFELFENPNTNRILTITSFCLQIIYLTKMFWFKNYVQYNKKGIITIKVNSAIGKTFMYKDIKNSQLDGKQLLIKKNNGTTIKFNLDGITESDVKKLYTMVNKNTIANTVYN